MTISIGTRKPVRDERASGGIRVTTTPVTLDNSYPTGGWPITARQLGFPTGSDIIWAAPVIASTGHSLTLDITNMKIKAFSAMGTELANASAALNGVIAVFKVEAR